MWFRAIGFALMACGARAAQPAPVEVMVLGAYHFGNPGLDLHNVKADDVLAPRRQRELADLAERLARFRPTRVMVERTTERADLADVGYAAFEPADLASERNEVVQIAYRVARRAGVAAVNAIDEQPGPGEPDYFPFGRVDGYAKAHGQTAVIATANALVASFMAEFDRRQRERTIAGNLAAWNVPATQRVLHSGLYYGVLGVGDAADQPGAELNAYWYMRNAKIFAKLMRAARPGDRVLVVFGAGHKYWLDHFAETTPGYSRADPMPFLIATEKP